MHTSQPVSLTPVVDGPIIEPSLWKGDEGANINGPSLIEAPSFFEEPLGRYYLYFGHHNGLHIRLATADSLEGPWKIHEGGVIPVELIPEFRDHVSSPDARVVGDELHLYVHGGLTEKALQESPFQETPGTNTQATVLLSSKNGLDFKQISSVLAPYYLRVFDWRGETFGMAWGAQLLKAESGHEEPFTPGPVLTDALLGYARPHVGDSKRCIRHVAVDVETRGGPWVYFTCIGDSPESILRSRLNTDGQWKDWHLEAP